jgi:phosphatidylglycerol---prolipoprotein diacylglyceryl transferase
MLPKLFSFGDFFLPTYGVLVATGFFVALQVVIRQSKRAGLDPEKATNLAIYCALAGLAGAKLLMFVFDFRLYAQHPEEIFSMGTLQAAGVFQGGLILAAGFAFWYMKRNRMPPLETADAFAPGIAIGHAIGRLGCFAAGCCWGTECTRPWAITFHNPDAYRLVGVPLNRPLHPAQLYEVFTELVLFSFLLWRSNRMPSPRPGEILGLYLVFSSISRFAIEFFRAHQQALPFGGPFSLTQWIALGVLLPGVWLVMRPGRAASAVSA